MRYLITFLFIIIIFLSSCSIPNPRPEIENMEELFAFIEELDQLDPTSESISQDPLNQQEIDKKIQELMHAYNRAICSEEKDGLPLTALYNMGETDSSTNSVLVTEIFSDYCILQGFDFTKDGNPNFYYVWEVVMAEDNNELCFIFLGESVYYLHVNYDEKSHLNKGELKW